MSNQTRSHLSVMAATAFIALTLFHAVPARAVPTTTAQKEQYVVDFMVNAKAPATSRIANAPFSGDTNFLSSLPTGYSYNGIWHTDPNDPPYALQDTCFLQNNVLYAIKALQPFTSQDTSYDGKTTYVTGSAVSSKLISFYDEYYPKHDPTSGAAISEQTLNYCAVGTYKTMMSTVPTGKYYHITQTTNVETSTTYEVATDFHASYTGYSLGTDPKNLMKYGCLLEVLRGHTSTAEGYFNQVLGLINWDTDVSPALFTGFVDTAGQTEYDTRDLAYFLICEQALPTSYLATADPSYAIRNAVRSVLWEDCWDDPTVTNPQTGTYGTGGIWTNYVYTASGRSGVAGTFGLIHDAKMTNEIAPLVLLGYQTFTWSGFAFTYSPGSP